MPYSLTRLFEITAKAMAPAAGEEQSPSEKTDVDKSDATTPANNANSQAQSHHTVESAGVEAQTEKNDSAEGVLFKGPPPEDESQYPGPRSVAMIVLAIYLAMFLVSLDRTIVATAIPRLTDEFRSFNDIGWYASAYILTGCAVQLPLGRVYTFYSPKWVFLWCIAIFEAGSAICGGALNSATVVVGRAIAGVGCAGVFSGSMQLIVTSIPRRTRPIYMGCMGAIFGVSSVVGPLLGGALTSNGSWRWCFLINLPIGAVTVLILIFILKGSPPKDAGKTIKEKVLQLDPLGFICLVPAVTCLLLALQWAGSTYSWKNARIIVLFILSVIFTTAFLAIQVWKKGTGTIPIHVIKQRSMAASFAFALCIGGAMLAVIYYLPVWFQGVKGASPVHSGIMTIPMLLSLVVGNVSAGFLVSKVVGYAPPFMIASSVIMSAGAGLLTTFTTETGHAKWIGYQVIFGFGLGMGMQQGATAIQAAISRQDIPTGISLIFFAQSLGGAVCICIAQNVLSEELIKGLKGLVPDLNAATVLNLGATEIRNLIPASSLGVVLKAYNSALVDVFYVATAVACLSIAGALMVEWRNVKGKKPI